MSKARAASLWEYFYVEDHPDRDGSVCFRTHWDTYLTYHEGSACLRGDAVKPAADKRAKFYLFDATAVVEGGKGLILRSATAR